MFYNKKCDKNIKGVAMKNFLLSFLMLFIITFSINAQTKIDKYWDFINNNHNYNLNKLVNDHPIGLYKGNVPQSQEIQFYDSVCNVLQLTTYEKELIDKHGFMVTERLKHNSCWRALEYIHHKDLPVMITTDFVLDAFHVSYDAILRTLEEKIIINKLSALLEGLHNKLEVIQGLETNVNDLDVYLTVARKLLVMKGTIEAKFPENQTQVTEILNLIATKNFQTYLLLSTTPRKIDFSQFTVRGHYTLNEELGHYFKCMIWLGRTEFYLIAPEESESQPKQTIFDIQRQIIDAYLLQKLINDANQMNNYNDIDKIIESMVGFSDNVQFEHLTELKQELGFNDLIELLDTNKIHEFQNLLATKEYSEQRILSQILMSPYDQKQIKPASAFMFLGQRFLIDSYICGNLVFDKIINEDKKVMRMLPSVNDVLFSLGNNPSLEFLKTELERYPYSKQLAATRMLIDSYDETYWENSIYGLWLNAIRTLNTPEQSDRTKLPAFMQTAAWWQEKMNTQLSSWAQLRRDNILYGKQSYTGGGECSYPYVYIEPNPEFYQAMSKLAKKAYEFFSDFSSILNSHYDSRLLLIYFDGLDSVSRKLYNISLKELSNEKISDEEFQFLCNAWDYGYWNCVWELPGGWIGKFYIGDPLIPEVFKENWQIIADIHTAPTDASGNMVGWVKHVATGMVNLGVFIAPNYEGKPTAYVGPTMSFHEYTTSNFERLNDEEWIKFYNAEIIKGSNSFRPDFVDLYLADKNGGPRSDYPASLPIEAVSVNNNPKESKINISTYPNPFNENLIISFKIPVELSGNNVNLSIFDLEGRLIKTLVNEQIQSGNYSIKWDALNSISQEIPNGTYICKLQIGTISETIKISCIRK